MTVDLRQPEARPHCPNFSSGPCAKRPGWSLESLSGAVVGRSHRSKPGKAKLQEILDRSRKILNIPTDYRIGIVPASDTGAVEMALWSLLGARGVDMLAWESFGEGWVTDVLKQLKLTDARKLLAPYGELPDLAAVDPARDIVFTWNGTTSGVRVPNGDWISDARAGLTICDATSAAFAMDLPWSKLDVVTWSWQKVLGGEGAHGMIVLSPRAVARLQSYTPAWPLPKIFRMTSGGKLIEGIFSAETINTPSMLAAEDAVDGLKWAEAIGGLPALIQRSERNFAALDAWVARTPWIDFLAKRPETRSTTSVCLSFTDPAVAALPPETQAALAKDVASRIEGAKAGLDVASYRDAPPGLRIWAGATVETSDIEALLPWIEWAYAEAGKSLIA